MPSPPTHAALVPILERLQVAKYFAALGNQLLLWDYCLTFSDEVKYIWHEPWRSGKILFLLTRYPAIVESFLTYWNQLGVAVSHATCGHLFAITGVMFICEVVIAELILTIRVWALYGRSRRIGLFLSVMAVACCVVTGAVFFKFHTSQEFLKVDEGITVPLPGCYPVGGSNVIVIAYIMLLGYEVAILGLTLFKGFWRSRHQRSSLINGMLQDGVVYFVVQAASLVNVLIFLTQPHEYANLLTPLQRSLHSILSARMVIRLRQQEQTGEGGKRPSKWRLLIPWVLSEPARANHELGAMENYGVYTLLRSGRVGESEIAIVLIV
ncbi:hypothetical protein AB1N83_011622 [Pleurotus pulmonarius]